MRYFTVLVCLLSCALYGQAPECEPSQYGPPGTTSDQEFPNALPPPSSDTTPEAPAAPAPDVAPAPQDPCSGLSYEEKEFATQLSATHRSLFCQQFSAEQRAMAMAYASQGGQTGKQWGATRKKMTPDEAVELVLRQSKTDNTQGGSYHSCPQTQK